MRNCDLKALFNPTLPSRHMRSQPSVRLVEAPNLELITLRSTSVHGNGLKKWFFNCVHTVYLELRSYS